MKESSKTFSLTLLALMSTATLPVELLIEIFELAMTNVGPEVGVSQLASESSKKANASGQAAPTESSDGDSDNEDSDNEDSNDDDNADDDDDEKWDEGYIFSSSDDESEGSGDWEVPVGSTQCKEDEEQGSNALGVSEMRRQRDGAIERSPMKACRLVCRLWNNISTPLLFWSVNIRALIVPHHTIPLLREFEKHIVRRYGPLIHAMTLDPHPNFRLFGAHKRWRLEAAKYDYLLSSIIMHCPNLEFLRLEYLFRRPTPLMDAAIVGLFGRGRGSLKTISFISQSVIADRWTGPPGGWSTSEDYWVDNKLLQAVLHSPVADRTLRRLDVALPFIDHTTWEAIRLTKFDNLQTLSFRRCLWISLGPIWRLTPNTPSWASNEHLTTLEFYDCQNANATLLCELVRHFPSLRRLIVCTSGHDSDYQAPPPKRGWSTDPKSLPRVRGPLDFLHIEHGCQWEVLALAVVPTKTLMVTNVAERVMQSVLRHDAELFIGLETLRIRPPRKGVVPEILDNECRERGWKLVRDAVMWRPCRCHEPAYL